MSRVACAHCGCHAGSFFVKLWRVCKCDVVMWSVMLRAANVVKVPNSNLQKV